MVAPFSLTCHSLFVERRAAAARNLTSLAGRLTPLSCPPTSQGGVPRWLLRRRDLCKYSRLFLLAEADTRLSPGDKNVICSAAPLPSPRRLGLAPPCQETQQQNLKPPQLLPPRSLPVISDFGKEADPDSVSRVKSGHLDSSSGAVLALRAWPGYPCPPQGGLPGPE